MQCKSPPGCFTKISLGLVLLIISTNGQGRQNLLQLGNSAVLGQQDEQDSKAQGHIRKEHNLCAGRDNQLTKTR